MLCYNLHAGCHLGGANHSLAPALVRVSPRNVARRTREINPADASIA
ncbi:hypothetical protein K788_0006248 (plasmid) [Paraburkholderia caribensis MBA4]|uniref:Uncharacterized protein n=1 Tax=Paraburkholderia caribensis MBA4 TaxID=1323664 RepID=A0A0P0RLN7_9BURK|nr:hypothetical protein K788_0006248 [Paraburkholderia caribensis MBA4]